MVQVLLIVIAVGFVIAAALFVLQRGIGWRAKKDRSAPELVLSGVPSRAGGEEAGPGFSGVLDPVNLGERRRFTRPLRLDPPFEPVTSRSFKNDDFRIVIGGVEGPEMEGVCRGAQDELWACGLEARASLHALLRGQSVTCESFAPGGAVDLLGKGQIPAACTLRGQNLAVEMVRTGFVRPAGLADRAILAAEEEARAAGRGLWRGGWRIIR